MPTKEEEMVCVMQAMDGEPTASEWAHGDTRIVFHRTSPLAHDLPAVSLEGKGGAGAVLGVERWFAGRGRYIHCIFGPVVDACKRDPELFFKYDPQQKGYFPVLDVCRKGALGTQEGMRALEYDMELKKAWDARLLESSKRDNAKRIRRRIDDAPGGEKRMRQGGSSTVVDVDDDAEMVDDRRVCPFLTGMGGLQAEIAIYCVDMWAFMRRFGATSLHSWSEMKDSQAYNPDNAVPYFLTESACRGFLAKHHHPDGGLVLNVGLTMPIITFDTASAKVAELARYVYMDPSEGRFSGAIPGSLDCWRDLVVAMAVFASDEACRGIIEMPACARAFALEMGRRIEVAFGAGRFAGTSVRVSGLDYPEGYMDGISDSDSSSSSEEEGEGEGEGEGEEESSDDESDVY